MMDCKKALMELGGDIEEAAVFLCMMGLAKANKKDSCVVAKGKITFSNSGNKAVLVKVNCETNFVGKDTNFGGFGDQVVKVAVDVENDLGGIRWRHRRSCCVLACEGIGHSQQEG